MQSQRNERQGEINDDVALMREWSQFPVKVIDRSNIEPRVNGAIRTCRISSIHVVFADTSFHVDDFDA